MDSNTVQPVPPASPSLGGPVKPVVSTPAQSPLDEYKEVAHVTEELYKKNYELAEKNKVLTLIRQIDGIILSSITDINQVSTQVSDVITEESGFIKAAGIFLLSKNKDSLQKLAFSQRFTDGPLQAVPLLSQSTVLIPLTTQNNILALSFLTRQMVKSERFNDIVMPFVTEMEANSWQKISGIKIWIAYPFAIRGEVIGVLLLGIDKEEKTVTQSDVDLLDRLPGIIGIAIDNCLLYSELQESYTKLRELDKLKDDFFSLASHELRTPLTAIRGNAALIKQYYSGKIQDKDFNEMVQDISDASSHLIQIVSDFLDMSRLEQGKIEFKKQPFDFGNLIQKIMKDMEGVSFEKGVTLQLESADVLPQVFADPDRVRQIAYNLVGNALKYSEKGEVKVSVKKEGDFVKTLVSDTGVGIAHDKQKLLFQKFQQAGASKLTPTGSQSSGLGLYISKLLSEGMGGKIALESSELGKGSVFSFSLPIANKEILPNT